MKQVWINKQNNKELIIFFNGWGMDERIVKDLDVENYDVLTVFDYQAITKIENIENYEKKYLVAWSMGVYMSQICSFVFDKKIAINGTLVPIDAKYGIHPRIYDLTINNFNEQTKNKFAQNMGIDYELGRTNEELKNELIEIKNIKNDIRFNFDKAIVSLNDKIFSAKSQIAFWNSQNVPVQTFDANHCVFSEFKSWGEILNV